MTSTRDHKKTRRGRGRPALGPSTARLSARTRIAGAVSRIAVTSFLSYREYLLKIYELLKAETPSYSYGQLGEDLGFSHSNVLWLVISGRRRLSPKAGERIIVALGLVGVDRRYFETLRAYNNARRTDQREDLFQILMELKTKALPNDASQKVLEYFSEWYHPVVREMVALPEFSADPQWINERLVATLMPMQILKSLDLLTKLGLIAYDAKKGRYVQTGGQIFPDRDVERMASVRFHQKMCDLAREAVTRVSAARREMNTLTVRISEDMAMRATAILFKACEQIMKLEAESKTGDQIYQVNLHLFPLTKTTSKEKG